MVDDARNSKRSVVRCRDDNPAGGVRGPDRGERAARQYLYASECLKFLQCETVPMTWRRLVAVAIYSYARAGELRALTWDDVDLDKVLRQGFGEPFPAIPDSLIDSNRSGVRN